MKINKIDIIARQKTKQLGVEITEIMEAIHK